jgi:glycosyltransferase involved in cell wall biosynthesis
MQAPKISIIIPFYNRTAELVLCLDSIKNQTFKDYEVIIINDGSTDIRNEEVHKNIVQIIPNVKYCYQENKGAPTARNNGFKKSTGKYIIFCDADITMEPDMLEKMNSVLDENKNISYAYSSFKFGWKTFKLWEFSSEKLREMPYIHTTSLIRREHFPSFDESLKRLQDWDLWLTMLKQEYKGKWINQVLFSVKRSGSISTWIPSIFVKLGIGRKTNMYKQAVKKVKKKHLI